MDTKSMMLQCCDTALDDLTPETMNRDLIDLGSRGLVTRTPNSSVFSISPTGILYVRKYLIKPLIQFAQDPDFTTKIAKINTPTAKHVAQVREQTLDKNTGLFNKGMFSEHLVTYAISNIGPVMSFLTTVMNLLSGVPSAN